MIDLSLSTPSPQSGQLLPISSYIVKIASRCNLNCKYCYMYNLADKSYQLQPAFMSEEVVAAALTRIRNHALRHKLKSVGILFHGGEPLLAGEQFFRHFVETANATLKPEITPTFTLQTNATLLSPSWLELLNDLRISFGISLDGTPEIHDANRVDHQGRGSYEEVAQAIGLINSGSYQGRSYALTVINLESDPIEVYRHIRSLKFEGVDFLFPDGTYDNPPPGKFGAQGTAYADWLIPIFDEWFDDPDDSFGIRVFENIIGMIFGSRRSTDNIGGRRNSYVVIETDGGIEPVDVLKACGEGFTKLGLNVIKDEIDQVYEIPLFRLALGGPDGLCQTCKKCPVVDVCGGGYLPHRYRSLNGFDNPSLYCEDLMKLISHIQERTLGTLTEEMRSEMRLATLSELRGA